jgi:hypothetical protein
MGYTSKLPPIQSNPDSYSGSPSPSGAVKVVTTGDSTPPHVVDARARLVEFLSEWANMHEASWTEEDVDRLKNKILDVFSDYPTEADGWYRAWRVAHPTVRLA